ncbi:hypothetical protein H6G95_30790 [Nostoc linckia FACHB-391]|uniref:DNA polymerase Y-family little finger domain-containing protein n=2 Tax=Nostoc TaxID=1177 RepID=A0ABR8IL78_9NOSO|nr:hypothetical protein [Nostoc linckia FACHB-391]MBD2651438.1 hypothetical protein [Nostoc foliaceum FACHB-393]
MTASKVGTSTIPQTSGRWINCDQHLSASKVGGESPLFNNCFLLLSKSVKQRLEQHETRGRTLTLKVKFSDFQQLTRSKTMLAAVSELSTIFEIAKALFESIDLENRSIRLLGISLSNLDNAKQTQVIQLPLFQNAGIIF